LIEDGPVTSTTQELIYKPSNWRNHDERWRYNLFAGQESKLFSNWDQQSSGDATAGASINYLLHPRVILGLSARQARNAPVRQLHRLDPGTASVSTPTSTRPKTTAPVPTCRALQLRRRQPGNQPQP
jgi:hypothetical protein